MSLRLDTFAENVLVKGYHRTYIRLRNREKIIVTCSKSEPQQNGTLMAFVNTKLATQVKCLRFHRDFINDDNFCESKQFVAYVEADQSSFVDVWCRMLYDQYKSEAYAELFLSRLCMILYYLICFCFCCFLIHIISTTARTKKTKNKKKRIHIYY